MSLPDPTSASAAPQPAPAPALSPAPLAPRRRWVGVLVTLLLIGALVAGAWALVQRSKAPTGGAAAPAGGPPGFGGPPGGGGGSGGVTVGMARATQGALPVMVEALGTVTPAVTATLVPQVSGTLVEVLFTEGQTVQKGQLLARIDPRSYEQALQQARAQRARDEAQLAAARVTLGRYQTLWKQDSIARQDVDTQAALVQQLAATVAADKAAEQAAQLNLSYTRITAPISGRVGLRAVDPGNLVGTGTTGGIATITQLTPIDVEFAVPQDRLPDVRAAQRAGSLPVTALDRARSQTLAEGRFSTLDNAINTTTGTVRAKARFDNADGALFPNQFVNVRLKLGESGGVLVPVTAVRTGPNGDYVYVVDDQGVAHMRPVQRGLATVDRILIASGLQAGERVVTEGGDRVKDGGRVRAAGEGEGGGAGRTPGASAARGAPARAGAASAGASAASAAAPASGPNQPVALGDAARGAMNPEASGPLAASAPAPAVPASQAAPARAGAGTAAP